MQEIEIKAHCPDLVSAQKYFTDQGFIFGDTLHQDDTVFRPIGKEYGDLLPGDTVLRIRNSNGRLIMNVKKQCGSISNELQKLEAEVDITDRERGCEFIKIMGYYQRSRSSKTRIKATKGDITICLDNVTNLGTFIEVEQLCPDDADGPTVQQQLLTHLTPLGITTDDLVLQGYDVLLYLQDK